MVYSAIVNQHSSQRRTRIDSTHGSKLWWLGQVSIENTQISLTTQNPNPIPTPNPNPKPILLYQPKPPLVQNPSQTKIKLNLSWVAQTFYGIHYLPFGAIGSIDVSSDCCCCCLKEKIKEKIKMKTKKQKPKKKNL